MKLITVTKSKEHYRHIQHRQNEKNKKKSKSKSRNLLNVLKTETKISISPRAYNTTAFICALRHMLHYNRTGGNTKKQNPEKSQKLTKSKENTKNN